MPEVSIITPLYNGSKTLLETADSVLQQDYHDWEWILFDDGSTDGTQQIAKKLCEENKDKLFYYEHSGNKNFGTAYTRNQAVAKSSGKLISFLDQDDVWYSNRLSRHIKIFDDKMDCCMIWAPVLYWYKERSFKQPISYKGKELKKIYDPPAYVDIILSDLRVAPLPSSSIVRRENFDAVKGYDETIKGSEDIVLLVKLANQFKIYYDDVILVKHRKHQDSTLRQAAESGKMNEWNLTFYKWVIDFLKKNSGKNPLINDYEFAYYTCLKKISRKKNYLDSRKDLLKGLNQYPELKKKFLIDFFLDLVLPFSIATKVSAKLRFDIFKKNKF